MENVIENKKDSRRGVNVHCRRCLDITFDAAAIGAEVGRPASSDGFSNASAEASYRVASARDGDAVESDSNDDAVKHEHQIKRRRVSKLRGTKRICVFGRVY